MSVVPPLHVRLTTSAPRRSLDLLLGEDAPRLTGGFGGWEVVERPQDVAMTIWKGTEPFQLTFGVMLDAFARGGTVDRELQTLIGMARGSRNTAPPVLRLEGIRAPAVQWVVEELELDEPMLRVRDGKAIRQPATITLRQYVPPEYAAVTRKPERVVVIQARKGDTPASIAKRRRLKSWKELQRLNPKLVRKANQVLKQGTDLRVPPQPKDSAKSKGKRR